MEKESRREAQQVIKKNKKHRKRRWVLLTVLAIVLAGAGSAIAYSMHVINPQTHFSHLKTIGSSKKALSGYKERSGVLNILLIGSDQRKKHPQGHTDSILLVHADLNHHRYNVLSIPRDTRVYMKGVGYTKLTSVQFLGQVKNGTKAGIMDAVAAVSNLTGVPINYYAETNYWGFRSMVDALGGISMKVPFNVTLTHPWNKKYKNMVIKKGTHELNGTMVSEVVHERDSLPGTDFGRQRMQEEALIGIANKVMQPANLTKLPALSRSMSKFLIATNLSTSDMISLGLGVKSDYHPRKQIHYFQLKYQNVVMLDDALQAQNDEVVLDTQQLQQIIQQNFMN
ncbi:MAG: LCP family protein [Sporolactobacillus sp.]